MIKLHLGCGKKHLYDFIHIDIQDMGEEEYILDYEKDVTDLGGLYEDKSVDEIYASHVLDHLSRNTELDKALSEWYRVLKPGGILRVAVSDFGKVVDMYNEGLDLERLWGHIVGGHKKQYDKHGCVFDYKLLKRYLEKHGFKDIKRYRWQDFLPDSFDDLSRAYIPHLDFENGILMSLNVEATK